MPDPLSVASFDQGQHFRSVTDTTGQWPRKLGDYDQRQVSFADIAQSRRALESDQGAHDADATASPSSGVLNDSARHIDQTTNLDDSAYSWSTTTAPYPAFTPQPEYVAVGELPHEEVIDFDHFDSPSSFRQSEWPITDDLVTHAAALKQDLNTAHTQLPVSGNSTPRPKSALKRPLNSDPDAQQQSLGESATDRPDVRKLRRVSFERMSAAGAVSADDEDSVSSSDEQLSLNPPTRTIPAANTLRRGRGGRTNPNISHRAGNHQMPADAPSPNSRNPSAHSNPVLQPEKVFPIQIGSEVFRLSGASISSDAPSYFTQFFEEQLRHNEDGSSIRPLYIDRDPETFRDVARHLQGYYVKPRDGSHFVKLFADAQFYGLPRLIDQLFDAEIFIQIGEKHFQIPKDVFSDPGNSPNFFSLGFAVFFSTPGEVFPGLDRRGLLRPPSITPPCVPGRSADIFAQLLHALRGYPLHIRNETHRAELLRDCRYFHLRGLEQKLIAHEISYNLERQQKELCLRIEDIKPSGISYNADENEDEMETRCGWVRYRRPFVDDESYELIVEIGGECTILDLDEMRADLHGLAKARVSSLFQVVANKMNLPTNAPFGAMMLSGGGPTSQASPGNTPLSEDRVKIRFEPSTAINLNGAAFELDWTSPLGRHTSTLHDPAIADEDAVMADDSIVQEKRPQSQRARSSQSQISTAREASKPSMQRGSSSQMEATVASRKRRRPTTSSENVEYGRWILDTAQWRLRVQPSDQDATKRGYEIVFVAVKIAGFSQERARNARRNFLGGT